MEKILEKLRLLILTVNLSLVFSSAWAACFPNGDISGANGQIILGTPGCADASGNTASVLSGATITNLGGDALLGPGVAWTISNAGALTASGSGINLQAGGSITNQANGTIITTSHGISTAGNGAPPITLENFGTITSASSGGQLLGGATVINHIGAMISGQFTGLSISANGPNPSGGPSLVDNAGTIQSTTGFNDGILLGLGGTVINRVTGLIDGFVGVAIDAVGTVDNFGQIGTEANTSTAIGLGAGGTVTNHAGGQLLAGTRGVDVSGASGTVINAGLINVPTARAISMSAGGSVFNLAGGQIIGGSRGVFIDGGTGTVENAGTIIGDLLVGGFPAIELHGASSSVTNMGTITGNVAFFASNDSFLMTAGQMTGQLLMGPGGNETATFQDVTDVNTAGISVINGGGGGSDQLIFNNSQHTGGSEMINWETITLNNGSVLVLSSNLVLGGLSADKTATLNINSSTLRGFNRVIQSNGAFPALVNNAGTIDLASPNVNNSLTIRGVYMGLGGILNLNSVLNGDGSPADKLILDGINGGSSASGNTFVTVHNLGGTGALTTANGILVVQAINNSTTAPNSFNLSAPIRVGAYDYRLFRGGLNPNDPATAQDWFLRSTFIPPSVPPAPQNLLPILGPELSVYGSVLPTALAIGRATVGTLHERVGDEVNLLNDNLSCNQYANGIWIRALGQHYKENYSSIANPSSSTNITGLQLGVDVYRARTANHLNLAGFYAAYTKANPNIDGRITNPQTTANINVNTGSINLGSTTGGVYWTHFWQTGAYVDLVAQASSYHGHANSFRASISLNGTATGISAEFGYPILIAQTWQIEPETQVIYQHVNMDKTFDQFSSVNLGSSNGWVGRVGARVKYTREVNKYSLQPYLRANLWSIISGNKANTDYANTTTITTSNNNSWAQLGGGITMNLTNIVSVYFFVDDLLGLSSHSFSSRGIDGGLGLRANW